MKSRVAGLLTVILLVFSLVTACAKPVQQPAASPQPAANPQPASATIELRFTWWGGQARHDATLAAIKVFEQRHPNVKVKPEFSSIDGYEDKMITQIGAKNGPDLMQVDWTFLKNFINKGVLADLTPYKSILPMDQYDKNFFDKYQDGAKPVALPTGVNTIGLVYNKAKFDAAKLSYPTDDMDWNQVLDLAKKLTVPGKQYGMEGLHTKFERLSTILAQQYGGHVFAADGKSVAVNAPEVLEGYAWVAKFATEGASVPAAETNKQGFNLGQVAMTVDYLSLLPGIQAELKDPLGIAIIPKSTKTVNGKQLRAPMFQPAQLYSINKDAKHPKEAAELMAFLLADPEAVKIQKFARGIPAAKSARDALAPTVSGLEKAMLETLNKTLEIASQENLKAEPLTEADPEIFGEGQLGDKAWEAVVYKQMSLKQAMDDAKSKMDKALRPK